jgi:soluble lytic murein transglycosylase-like protein
LLVPVLVRYFVCAAIVALASPALNLSGALAQGKPDHPQGDKAVESADEVRSASESKSSRNSKDEAGRETSPSGAAAQPGSPGQATAADLRDSVCLMIEAAARVHDVPLEFFARVIWQESRMRPDAVGPRTRSGDNAQGIAQFMPKTAAERGLLDPFDPVEALPKSAQFLRELRDQFGNWGLAAAAYNAGPARVRAWLAGSRTLPPETRHYVAAITGKPAEEWAYGAEPEPAPRALPSCGQLMALLQRGPNPFIEKLTQRVKLTAESQWGIQLSAGFSRERVLAAYATLANRYSNLLSGRDATILSSVFRTRGTQTFYQIRVGTDTRESANSLCAGIRRAGGACMVLRNRS